MTSFKGGFFVDVSILLTSVWQPERMPPDMDERWLGLITSLSKAALDLAASAATISQPVDGPVFGLRFAREIAHQQQEMETLIIAVLRHSGIPWDVLASSYGVTRQSLHRRLAASVEEALKTDRNQPAELRQAERQTGELADTAFVSFTSLGHLDQAVAVWRQRRAQPRWWTEASYSFE
ncbi:hypothetical protein ACFPZI_27665 [Streptomyces chlorus]|uniref:Uncharacterized protein n=1 Tax=Streptomyces chlorus TaxID=887452 RepID=A0ABW1E3H9_9ACTN